MSKCYFCKSVTSLRHSIKCYVHQSVPCVILQINHVVACAEGALTNRFRQDIQELTYDNSFGNKSKICQIMANCFFRSFE